MIQWGRRDVLLAFGVCLEWVHRLGCRVCVSPFKSSQGLIREWDWCLAMPSIFPGSMRAY